MKRGLVSSLFIGICFLVAPLGAQAQSWGLTPNYGSVQIRSGFTPDPYALNLQAGGSISAQASIGGSCAGYVSNAPDFRIHYSAGSFPLYFFVRSSSDTTLVVNAPNGLWYCNDDYSGLNPAVIFNSPLSGQYDIWVGTYSSGGLRNAQLLISELYTQ